jgi:hypothetical protein
MLFSNLEQEMSRACSKRARKAVSRVVSALRLFELVNGLGTNFLNSLETLLCLS